MGECTGDLVCSGNERFNAHLGAAFAFDPELRPKGTRVEGKCNSDMRIISFLHDTNEIRKFMDGAGLEQFHPPPLSEKSSPKLLQPQSRYLFSTFAKSDLHQSFLTPYIP